MQTIQMLMVRDSDKLVLGTLEHQDDSFGPIEPNLPCPIDGASLVRYDAEVSWAGRRNTEVAHLVDDEVVWSDPTPIEQLRADAIGQIDAAGEALRMAILSLPTQSEEYRRVEAQARAWRAAGYPEGDDDVVPRGVTGWAQAKWRDGWTNRQACDDILATADAWLNILDTIRDLRLANKEDVRHAASGTETN
ncbi:hypothetical protein, partial [Agrobacterium tumefaciens]|uniref:hypothetical protein n=1 Tax=Agrobacterium tumefaciens TaxID=358 RepID=UPI001BACC26D